MGDGVPPIDREQFKDRDTVEEARFAAAEYDLYKLEDKSRRLRHLEINQRYWLRWLVVALGLLVITGMTCLLYYTIHKMFLGPFVVVPSSLAIVMLIAPIVSITTITVVFFVAAFRKFKNSDIDAVDPASLARNGVHAMSGALQ